MKIKPDQINNELLTALVRPAVEQLFEGNYEYVAKQFGYALAYGRDPAKAIKNDLIKCISDTSEKDTIILSDKTSFNIKHYKSNSSNIICVIECYVPLKHGIDGNKLLIEFVVTQKETDFYMTLEDISK